MTARDEQVQDALRWLQRRGTKRDRDGMARYGIVAPKAFGVRVADIQQLGKRLGRDHALAAALWDTGWYEARVLVAFVAEPERLTSRQMDRWARDFDNWAWALRSVGRRSRTLNAAAIRSAERLIGSSESTARWVGRDALRELKSPAVQRRLAAGASSGNRAARRRAG